MIWRGGSACYGFAMRSVVIRRFWLLNEAILFQTGIAEKPFLVHIAVCQEGHLFAEEIQFVDTQEMLAYVEMNATT